MSKVPLPGSEHAEPADARRVGLPAADQRLTISIVLRRRHPEGEAASAHREQGGVPRVLGADPQDIAAVEEFARQENLIIEAILPEQRMVKLSGTAAQLEQAFNVELAQFEHRGMQYVSHSGPVHLSAQLVPAVMGVFGLSNTPLFPRSGPQTATQAIPGALGPSQIVNDLGATLAAYNFPPTLDGTGQTAGIMAFGGGYLLQDLTTFFINNQGLAVPKIVEVSTDGTVNDPGRIGWELFDQEITQDICILGTIAPGATIVLYWGQPTTQGWVSAFSYAVNDSTNQPSVLSHSYGGPELVGFSGFSGSEMNSLDSYFADARLQAISVFVASGDDGSTDGYLPDHQQHVDFPAASPNVTGCGGTTLTIAGNGTIEAEVAWNDPPRPNTTKGVTGGGVSDWFSLPDYQAGVGVPINPTSNPPAGPFGRGVPDVAGHADGYNGIWQGALMYMNGTSAVAPLWAGLITLINQLKGVATGFLNDVLYARLAAFAALNDITTGTNGFWDAGPDWDPCTGWGSPDGAFIASLIGPPGIGNLVPSTGPVGGGMPVTIQGTRFTGAIFPSVTFGCVQATNITVVSDTEINVISPPAAAAGTVDVVVTLMQGSSGASSVSKFTYFVPIPVVSQISPSTGPAGTDVVVSGNFFTGVTEVDFGGVFSPQVTSDPNSPDTVLTASAPSGVSGRVHVTLTTTATSASTDLDFFTYQ
jgi:kumamolisin